MIFLYEHYLRHRIGGFFSKTSKWTWEILPICYTQYAQQIMLIIYIASFLIFTFLQSGYGSVSWLVFAELLPPAIRPTAYPLGIAIMWFVNFILTTLYEPLLTLIGKNMP